MKTDYGKVFFLFTFLLLARAAFAQQTDSSRVIRDSVGAISVTNPGISLMRRTDTTKIIGHFAGAVSVTNNGISLIPTFSLGKPAAIFDMSVGGRKLSFEPQLRFALDGKPCRAAL